MTAHPSFQPKSIVFLGTAHDNGGSSILAANLAEAMRAEGHHVEEWYLFGSGSTVLPQGVRVFINEERSRSLLLLIALFRRLVAELRTRKPDAIFGLQSLSNLLAGVAGRRAGIRNRVATHHNPAGRLNRVLIALDWVAGRLGFYTRMIACAETVAATYAGNGPAYTRRLVVVANGQKKPSPYSRGEARRELGLPSSGTVIGQIGRFSYQKNQNFTVDLMKEMPDATLLLVGSGPDYAAVQHAVIAAGLERRVRVVSAIDHARIGLFYAAIDVALFPSRFEGLSLAAIEAIHAGVPLICSDIPSFREMFHDSPWLTETLLVQLEDRAGWLGRIRAALFDARTRQRVAAELARLSPAFTFDGMATRYLAVLE